MDSKEEKKALWVTNICLRCDKEFIIKDWKIDDVRFKRICSGCKTTMQKKDLGSVADCSLSYF